MEPYKIEKFALIYRLATNADDLVIKGLKDDMLEYERSPNSFRPKSFASVMEVYTDNAFKSPTDVATQDMDPIVIHVFSDGKIVLADGRHRYITANKFGAEKIVAQVKTFDENEKVIDEYTANLTLD